jgi:hypothetical protein
MRRGEGDVVVGEGEGYDYEFYERNDQLMNAISL